MSKKTTELSAENLIIYPSERMRKSEDGGGLMRGTPLTGEDNELFNPTSQIELINGGFDARLIYPAVLTPDKSGLYGAYLIVGEPPNVGNVDVLLFEGAHYGESYAEARTRIEAYSAATFESDLTLLGNHLKGSKVVQCYTAEDAPIPKIGDRLCLKDSNNYNYIRIASIDSSLRSFVDSSNNAFTKRILSITCTETLRYNFQGVTAPTWRKQNTSTTILETGIADSAKYYGIRALNEEALKNSNQIKLPEIYAQLVPTSTDDTAWANQTINQSEGFIAVGAERENYIYCPNYFPYPIMPKSIKVGNITDDGKGNFSLSGRSYQIDYKKGIITGVGHNYNVGTVKWQPAVPVANMGYTLSISIVQGNQSREWAPILEPEPLQGTTTISYLSGDTWNTIKDNGSYELIHNNGEDAGRVSGNSVIFTLGDLPDVGSKIIISWVGKDEYKNLENNSGETLITPINQNPTILLNDSDDPRPFKPGTVTVSASGKSGKDDGKGKLAGDITGTIDYAAASIEVASIYDEYTVSAERYTGEAIVENLSTAFQSDGSFSITLSERPAKGSLLIGLNVIAMRLTQTGKRYVVGQETVKITNPNYSTGYSRSGGGYVRDLRKTLDKITDKYKTATSTTTSSASLLYSLSDNGNGGLLLNGAEIEGSILYATGQLNGRLQEQNKLMHNLNQATKQTTHSDEYAVIERGASFTLNDTVAYEIDGAVASFYKEATTERKSFTQKSNRRVFNLLEGKPTPSEAIFNSFLLKTNKNAWLYERNGIFYSILDQAKGFGNPVGELSPDGTAIIRDENVTSIEIHRGLYRTNVIGTSHLDGRTPENNVLPSSFSIQAVVDGKVLVGRDNGAGLIEGGLTGEIDYKSGVFSINSSDDAFNFTSVRINATTQRHTPLPQALIGIDTVRLRPDGKAPIFKVGDTILIHHRETHDLGSAHSAGQTLSIGRPDVDNFVIKDKNNKIIPASFYDYDLDKGEITWSDSLDLASYAMPLKAHSSREELNRILRLSFDGTCVLQNPLKRAYPKGTYVSSCLIFGNMQTMATAPFEQRAWTNVWQDSRIGDAILAKLNVKDYPISLSNDGAINERWLIQFTTANRFRLFGENLGLVLETDFLQDLSPINPATQNPYFTIPKEAFANQGSSAWASGNCIRFNTTGTNKPVWVIKSVQPNSQALSTREVFDICFRGDTQNVN